MTRFLPSELIKGRKQFKTKKTEFDIKASITPLTAKELMRLPEGQRGDGKIRIISTTCLQTARVSECRQADLLCYNKVNYEIDQVLDWSGQGGFFEMLATRADR